MTLPYNLEDNLANFGLLNRSKKDAQQAGANQNPFRRHIISFRYPAPELLWPGDKELLHLDTPSNIEQRHSALIRHLQPPDFSTDFFCALPIEQRPVLPPQSHNDYQSVLRAVSLLETKQGTSTFSVVRLATQGNCLSIKTRIRIDSSLEGNLSLREGFELSEEQWQGLLRWSHEAVWINILKNLVYRESDRAYYHVEDAVEKYWSWDAMLLHETSLSTLWDSRPPRTAEELAIGEQRRQLGEWLQTNSLWKDLDNADFSLRNEVLQIKGGTLYHVFHAAFDSMKSAELLCPSSMAFFDLAETKVGLQALEAFLFGSEQILSGTAAQILEGLIQKVRHAVIDPSSKITLGQMTTASGFWNSVKALLVRTMNFWLRRSCRKSTGAHHKFHLHNGVPFFSPSSWDASERTKEEKSMRNRTVHAGMYPRKRKRSTFTMPLAPSRHWQSDVNGNVSRLVKMITSIASFDSFHHLTTSSPLLSPKPTLYREITFPYETQDTDKSIEMAAHDEFLDAFNNFNLTRQNPDAPEDGSATSNNTDYSRTHPRRQPHHELSFGYPALNLLFPGEAAWLPPPHLVEYRTKPQKEDLRQDFYAPEVYHYMHSTQPAIDETAFQNNPTALNVVRAIDFLSRAPGRSIVSICPFKTPQNEIFVRLEIKRTSSSGNSDFLFWKLSISDWTALHDAQASRPWLQLLMDVVHRKTALTYLIASQKLQTQNGYLWRGDAEKWERKWNTRSARHAVTLFQNRLKMPGSRLRISVRDFDAAAARGEGKCQVQLPCGHEIQISKDDFQDIREENCKGQTCPTCDALILQKSDIEEAEMCINEAKFQHAVKMSDGWTELGWNDLSTSPVRFDKSILLMALHSAAWSLKAPALIASKYLNPFGAEETDIALRALEAWLQMQQQAILRSPSELVEALGLMILQELRVTSPDSNILEVPTPPGWKNFLQLWLTRAVKFAYQRGCDEIGQEHGGTHLHASDGLVYYQTPEAQRMQAMDALLGGMEM